VRLVKETGAARDSGCLAFIQDHPLRSDLVISHIRHATQGAHAIRNCQPFVRELGGAMHVFAHNGDLDRNGLARLVRGEDFLPIGETDSELAFCGLLERLRRLWRAAGGVPDLEARRRAVEEYAAALRALGPANFLYADGDALFAHGHKRIHPGEGIRPPGLHLLCHGCEALDTPGLRIAPEEAGGSEVLIASVPLSADGGWRALEEGELVVVRRGRALGPSA
jgi:predicted glutamine amidotransferase